VPDADAAVKAANASQFGLSGNIWTRDVELARKMAREIYTGGVFINGVTASDPRVPVGGVKQSGFGRELSSFGPHAFVKAQMKLLSSEARNTAVDVSNVSGVDSASETGSTTAVFAKTTSTCPFAFRTTW
jgi:delta 1-pyrroline-5-carboxylate dehydrogenase